MEFCFPCYKLLQKLQRASLLSPRKFNQEASLRTAPRLGRHHSSMIHAYSRPLLLFLIQSGLGNGVHWSDCRTNLIHLRSRGRNLASATALQKPRSTHRLIITFSSFKRSLITWERLEKERSITIVCRRMNSRNFFFGPHLNAYALNTASTVLQRSMTMLSCWGRISWRALKESSFFRSTSKYDIRNKLTKDSGRERWPLRYMVLRSCRQGQYIRCLRWPSCNVVRIVPDHFPLEICTSAICR